MEVWIGRDMFRKLGYDLDPSADLCVWHASERLLAVAIDCRVLQLNVITCYMPQAGLSQDEKQTWWNRLSQVISECPNRFPLLIMGDMNAKIGSVHDLHIGSLHADLEDDNGEMFRSLCNTQKLTAVCNTHEVFHSGTGWTFHDHRGSVSRLDYIAVSETILPGVVTTWVDQDMETMGGDHDHRPVMMHMQLQQQTDMAQGFKRRIAYDRIAARHAKKTQACNLFLQIPDQPWKTDVNAHWSQMRDQLQDLAQEYFPRPKRQQRQVYFSPKCWSLVCQRKDLRQLAKAQTWEVRHQELTAIFRAWKNLGRTESQRDERIHIHTARLQLSLTQFLRDRVDKHFRQLKKQEWKDWVQTKMQEQLNDLAAKPAQLFQILQPKRMITRAQNKHRRALPGFRDHTGQWVTSKKSIAWAWQSQFSEVENAVDVQVQDLYDVAAEQPLPDFQIQHLRQVPTIYL